MGLIKTAMQLGGAYVIINTGLKTYERHESNKKQTQQPSYTATSRDGSVYQHVSWCNGQCQGQCNGQQSMKASPEGTAQGYYAGDQQRATAETGYNTPPAYGSENVKGNGMQDMIGQAVGSMGKKQ